MVLNNIEVGYLVERARQWRKDGGAVTDEVLIAWKRGGGGEDKVNSPTKRAAYVKAARAALGRDEFPMVLPADEADAIAAAWTASAEGCPFVNLDL